MGFELCFAWHVISEWTSSNWSWQFLFLIYVQLGFALVCLWRRDTSPHANTKEPMMGSKTRSLLRPRFAAQACDWLIARPLGRFACVFLNGVCAPSVGQRHEFDQNTRIEAKLPWYRPWWFASCLHGLRIASRLNRARECMRAVWRKTWILRDRVLSSLFRIHATCLEQWNGASVMTYNTKGLSANCHNMRKFASYFGLFWIRKTQSKDFFRRSLLVLWIRLRQTSYLPGYCLH